MSRRWLLLPLLGIIWLFVGSVSAARAPTTLTYQADYFDNQWLSGDPVLKRTEVGIHFDWQEGSPGGGISADFFSARWTSSFTTNDTTMIRFFAEADDGIRILVDGQVMLNAYNGEAKPGFETERSVQAGTHEIVVEYYEYNGEARARVELTGLDGDLIAGQVTVGDDDCVIPESGPWPACATGGGDGDVPLPPNNPPANAPTDAACEIPASGPWPPCATGGTTPPATQPEDCVIPASGPWPDCAR